MNELEIARSNALQKDAGILLPVKIDSLVFFWSLDPYMCTIDGTDYLRKWGSLLESVNRLLNFFGTPREFDELGCSTLEQLTKFCLNYV